MEDRKFMYWLGTVPIISWLLYFLGYSYKYKTDKIVEAVILIIILTVVYYISVLLFFKLLNR
ncbi:hypothetical protein [Halobacillus halophilus]|uniref:hypothetical protein n=1 Tax=Halobacillus halophilus TaxID=1570 RepID=UPI001CD57D24|nr:hypothetical protein [Halobacillus halophilus]MCA1009165.1 hypothetical protein [Halobacillus halophilus]